MSSYSELAKLAARAAYDILSRALLFVALGGVLNLVLLALLLPELKRAMHPAAALLLGAVFAVGFPVGYLLLGKKHGLHVAATRLLKDKKDALLLYFCERLFAAIRGKAEWMEKFNQSGLRATLGQVLPSYLARLDNMPRGMRWLLQLALRQVKLDQLIELLTADGEVKELDAARLPEQAVARASALIDEKLFTPRLTALWVLGAVNLGCFALVKIWR